MFRSIITYRDTTSGTHWDNDGGANILGQAAQSSWDNYLNASKVQFNSSTSYILHNRVFQSNKAMAPFRNKGWAHFDRMSEILPNASARGSYAFSPMNSTAPGQLGDGEAVTTSSYEPADDLDKDHDGDGTTLISTVASKLRKIYSTGTTVDNASDDATTFNSIFPPPPSADTTSTNPISDPSSNLSSNPTSDLVRSAKGSRKTQSTPAQSRSGMLPRAAGPTRRTKAASRHSQASNNASEASSSILVHNMQGSINMLTATVRDSVAIDPITKIRQEAVRLLQREEGLSDKEQITLFKLFSERHALAQTYLAIETAHLRLQYLHEILKDHVDSGGD